MKCKICGARINDGDKFCPRCGTVKKTTDAKVKKENLFFVFSCIFGIIGFIGGFVAIVDYSKIAMVKKEKNEVIRKLQYDYYHLYQRLPRRDHEICGEHYNRMESRYREVISAMNSAAESPIKVVVNKVYKG